MLTRERKTLILDVLRRDGRLVAKTLSHELGLSEDTIRRDLRELASAGHLQRVHGGALPASPANAPLAVRARVATEGKIAIGKRAAGLVRPGQIVMLDGGTTALQVARHLAPDLKATVVTHSPTIAIELARHPWLEIALIGGTLFRHSMVTVGAVASEMIGRVRADLYFMGVTGVHPEHGLTTGDAEEAAVKRALSRQAAETVVLASSEKLGAVSPFSVIGAADIDTMIVERDAPAELTRAFGAMDVTMILA